MKRVAVPIALALASVCAAAAAPPPFNATEQCLKKTELRKVVRFRAADKTNLVGVLLGKGKRGLVLGHQGAGNLCNWFPFARALARSGFRVLAFDFRTYGASDIPYNGANARRFDLDMIAAVKLIRKRGAKTVVVAGGSLGAGTALVVAAQLQPRVQGVVSLSSPLSVWGLDDEAAARQLQVPVLYVGAKDDDPFADYARTLYEQTTAPDKQLMILEQGGHGTGLLRLRVVRDALTKFFRAHS